jgi:uncharacterized membrane protein
MARCDRIDSYPYPEHYFLLIIQQNDMKKLFDLRFVIGLFFGIIGIVLIVYAFLGSTTDATSINKWCGIIFTVFGVVMLTLSIRRPVE